jgi:hypothetical protein
MEHKREMWLMFSRTGVLVVGVTSVARGSEGESDQRCQCCRVCPWRPTLSVLQRVFATCLRKALDIPFYRTRRCPAVQGGAAMCYRGWRRSALSPVHELAWPSEKCLEPCRSTAVGAAWILLTLSCFRRGLRAIRRHGRTRGTIITCCRSNLRWDTGLIPS